MGSELRRSWAPRRRCTYLLLLGVVLFLTRVGYAKYAGSFPGRGAFLRGVRPPVLAVRDAPLGGRCGLFRRYGVLLLLRKGGSTG